MAQLPEVSQLEQWREGLCTEEKKEICDELIKKRRAIDDHDASVVQDAIERLERINYIVDKNNSKLISAIEDFENDNTIMSSDRTEDFNNLLMEFVRRFNNFVGSTKNREYHTEIIISELESLENSSSLEEEYEEKVSEFNVDLHGVFFTALRTIFVHEQAIKPSGREQTQNTDQGLKIDRQVTIKKDYILESDRVSTRARGYIDTLNDEINIRESVELYYESIERLYDWLSDHIVDRYQDLLEERKEIASEAEALYEEFSS